MCFCDKASREELNEDIKRREQVERDYEEVKMDFGKLSRARFDILPNANMAQRPLILYSKKST